MAGNGSSGYLDGPSSIAQFKNPQDMCDDGFGNVYVADSNNYRIRLININTNIGLLFYFSNNYHLSPFFIQSKLKKIIFFPVSTFAGNGTNGIIDGPALNAEFHGPSAILCQPSISTIFVSDSYYLRKIQNGLFKSILFFFIQYIFHSIYF